MHFEHVLVTTDLSLNATAAFELAAHQAKFERSRITLLTVVEDWGVPAAFEAEIFNPRLLEQYRTDLKRHAEEQLEEIATQHFHGFEVVRHAMVTQIPAYIAIAEYAD